MSSIILRMERGKSREGVEVNFSNIMPATHMCVNAEQKSGHFYQIFNSAYQQGKL